MATEFILGPTARGSDGVCGEVVRAILDPCPSGSSGSTEPVAISDGVPEGESEVARHERVHAVDGEIGQLKGFAVDPSGHQVTHVLLRERHLWGARKWPSR